MLGSAWLANQRKWRQQCADKKDWQMPTLKACKRWPSWQRTPLPWFYMVDRGLLCRMGWGWRILHTRMIALIWWGVMRVMAPSDRIPPADLRVLISHGRKWTRTSVILSKNRNADTPKNWRWLGYTSSVFGVEAVLAGKRETMCKLLKIAFSWFHGSCTHALRGPAAPWLHWLLRSGSHIGFKCLACREILPRWLWYCWCTSVTTCYYHKQLWCVFRTVPKSEKFHGTGPDLLESRSSPGGGGGFFCRRVGKRETKRPGMKWWAHRDDVVEQARELC